MEITEKECGMSGRKTRKEIDELIEEHVNA